MLIDKIDFHILRVAFGANIILIYIFLIGYFLYIKLKNKMELQKKEIKLLSEKAEIQTDYYKQINDYKKQVRRVYHDLKNLVLVAEALDNKKARENYLISLNEYFIGFDKKIHTGNEILDLIIDEKEKICDAKKIQFEYNLDFTVGGFINLIDICVIFGNILDNAIEACELYDGKRHIGISTCVYNDFLVIKCENSSRLVSKNKMFLFTQKMDHENHGLGLSCIQDSLNKYNGTFKCEMEHNLFKISILIPIKH